MKVGRVGVLLLSEVFDPPRWREALVVQLEEDWVKTLVRCSQSEVEKTNLASVTLKDTYFCLVVAKMNQLRIGVTEDVMALEASLKDLLALGKSVLESDEDLNYATASDPTLTQARKAKVKAEDSSSSSDNSLEDSEVVAELKKKWLGSGLLGDKKSRKDVDDSPAQRRHSKRFALIEKGKGRLTGSKDASSSQQAVLQAAVQSGDPLHGLLALQLSESMKRGRQKHRRRSPSSSDSSSGSRSRSSSEESLEKGQKGHVKAIHGYQRAGRRKFRRPLKYVRKFVRGIEKELGAEDRPFRITDYNRRIHFVKQQNLKRCHYLVSTILEYMLKEEFSKAALQTVLVLQSMHQAAIDNSWDVAWLLTHVEDPFKARIFGGDPSSLQHVTSYVKSMNDLARNTEMLRKRTGFKGETEEAQKDVAKGKGRQGKNREKDKEKDKGPSAVEG